MIHWLSYQDGDTIVQLFTLFVTVAILIGLGLFALWLTYSKNSPINKE